MKTKFKINFGGFTVNTHQTITRDEKGEVVDVTGIPVEVPAINLEGEVEYTAQEMIDLWSVFKTVTEEAPEVLGNFASKLVEEYYKAEKKVMPLHKKADKKAKESFDECSR